MLTFSSLQSVYLMATVYSFITTAPWYAKIMISLLGSFSGGLKLKHVCQSICIFMLKICMSSSVGNPVVLELSAAFAQAMHQHGLGWPLSMHQRAESHHQGKGKGNYWPHFFFE